jgi:RNA polymerase sigma-70 factor, ECF subfamily
MRRGRMSTLGPDDARRDRFEAIYESHYHRILGYALRRTNRDEAADVVAETFLTAWRRLEDVPDGRAALLWLYGTARRVLANQERARHRRERLSKRVRAELIPEVESVTLEPGANLAAAALTRLRADERELLMLVAWEQLDAGEIAQVYACSRNAVRIRLHRARRSFTRELARLGVSAKQSAAAVCALVEKEEPL